jgi:hypothetical protein
MNIKDKTGCSDSASAGMIMNSDAEDSMKAPRAHFSVKCYDKDGDLKWSEEVDNLVTTAGKTDIIDKYLKGSAYTAAWFCLLKGTGSVAVGDTLASHAGWSEVTPYAGNRPTITWGTTAAGSNTCAQISISCNASATVAGCGTSTVNTGTSGTLYNIVDFAASRSVISGDTLQITITLSAT